MDCDLLLSSAFDAAPPKRLAGAGKVFGRVFPVKNRRGIITAGLVTVCLAVSATAAGVHRADICIYGGTSSGLIAAVQAAHMGKSVMVVESSQHLGGMTTGGLSRTDTGNKAAIGGLTRKFYERIGRVYGKSISWTFEPHVASDVYRQMLRETRVRTYLGERLVRVDMKDHRIQALEMNSGDRFDARVFIDATYEGDLMALAHVSYTVGREPNSEYHETLNGVRPRTPHHQFLVPVDPYRTPGDPKSGLLPWIQSGDGGVPGSGDHKVQAYNFRLCLTRNPTNQIPIAPPPDYDPAQYELLARYIAALVRAGHTPRLSDFMNIQMMPHGKTDVNNNGPFSTDFIGQNYDYPDGDVATRARIWKAHENYTRGLLHFLATSPKVPESVRRNMQSWGLCKDEFQSTGGWPPQLYVREARRMISDVVITEHNCRGTITVSDSIGLASYNMDSHNCQRVVQHGLVKNEGDVEVGGFRPWPMPYGALVPKASQCVNLLVPVCLSASHIAYGSIRMEPVFMILGQAAATAGALAIDEQCTVQEVDVPKLQARLRADGQILSWPPRRRAGKKPAAGR